MGGGGGGGRGVRRKQKERSRGLGTIPPFMQSTTCRSCRACTIPQLFEIECAHVWALVLCVQGRRSQI